MKMAYAVASLFGLFITLPIWFYLLYKILVTINASELMFFLYWIYVPISIFIQICIKLFEGSK